MPFISYQEYLKEILSALQYSDYSLASRRMLDLIYDYQMDSQVGLKELTYQIRWAYLNPNKLNKTEDLFGLCQNWINQVNQLKIPEDKETKTPDYVFEAENIGKEYEGARHFKLHPLSIAIKTGELTAVVGENGNGKTTLLRLIAGELARTSGNVKYFGKSLDDWYQIKGQLAYIPQRPLRWYGTLKDNLHFFCTIHGISGAENDDHIEYILYRLGLLQFKHLKWTEISSGYRLRFEIAKALMMRPRLLILDEPLANLDINAQQLLLQDLKYLAQSVRHPMGIILSSQQLHELERTCQNIIFIKQGITLYSGEQKQFAIERKHNAFEIGGTFSLEELEEKLTELGAIRISDAGTVFIVNTPLEIDSIKMLELIVKRKIQVSYFRDISKSTRQLFQKDI